MRFEILGVISNLVDRIARWAFHRHEYGKPTRTGPPWRPWTVRWCERPWRGQRCGGFVRIQAGPGFSAPLTALANHFADSDGWRAYKWRNEELSVDVIRIVNPVGRTAGAMIADAQRAGTDRPLQLEADAVERLVGELK